MVRGLALCGILSANIVAITGIQVWGTAGADPGLVGHLYETLVHQRFFPVFSFLFGLSAVLFLGAARGGMEPPRTVLLARFGFLLPFGLAHQVLQPGEVLVSYAVIGIVFGLPASFLPRRAVLAGGTAATLASLLIAEGGVTLIPGLFLLGMAAGAYDVPGLIARRSGRIAAAFYPTALLAAGLNVWQVTMGAAAFDSPLPAAAGAVTGAAYAIGLLMLLRRERLHAALSFVLQPLGRLALTNYITATPLVIAADHLLDLGGHPRVAAVVGTALAILALQVLFSRAWLRHHRYGPLEWAWRCLTWWRLVPNRPRPAAER
ncbi:Uncharacterized membrane protein YeiB [Thermomonospora echinospora]|uniref:Uncharacterized membrane protein YeiB n=1 Tax=Thermomonospora echinospora TaxID=1992 RepID=A0A1H6CRV4_9ACTN|nr:DUF418 domain-containing protein [Thermomonospora echinospora]SEG75365.1 Uncharacterized membrane protein YeiB [Thermomonospora echinospora]